VAPVYIIAVFEKVRIKIKFLALYVNFFGISRLRDRFRMFIFEFLEGILTRIIHKSFGRFSKLLITRRVLKFHRFSFVEKRNNVRVELKLFKKRSLA